MPNPTDPFDGVEIIAKRCRVCNSIYHSKQKNICEETKCKFHNTSATIDRLASIPAMRRAVVGWIRDEGNNIVEQMKKLPRESQGFIRLAFVAGVHTNLADQLERGGHDRQ